MATDDKEKQDDKIARIIREECEKEAGK